jgi:hypothetical protein
MPLINAHGFPFSIMSRAPSASGLDVGLSFTAGDGVSLSGGTVKARPVRFFARRQIAYDAKSLSGNQK